LINQENQSFKNISFIKALKGRLVLLFLSKFLGADGFVVELKLVKDPLEGERHRLLTVVRLGGHLVDRLPQQVREVQHLRSQ
jgi:hypothetical protein